ncbi:MAG TPA: 4Fe-4S dicluster domain-containing protein, partial [Planctomycetota bacterium]|nr:4Fe-4S dicluster domain-containing protein [Planctomycetota bacterium]
RVEAPVWILPGQPDGVVTVHFGHGRMRAGRLGTGTGFDAYRIRTMDSLWHAKGVSIARTGERALLATTQNHHRMEGRDLVRSMTVAEHSARPAAPLHGSHGRAHEESFYPEGPRGREEEHAWGMVIDLAGCTGCGACVVACQAENNIPVVGKDQVARGREMHWIRIDVYHEGSPASPTTHHQPVPCMHCEAAPCEVVCPVGATVHGNEGLNEMVYNRCVGTRYCSNNCPYKVRRFNYYAYSDVETPSLKLLRNPDVTVRTRGVMEKCTYCVQRINEARIDARIEGRRLGGDDVKTACQSVCPSRAIVFGDLKDPSSQVAKLKESPLNYALLGELNTRPRTTYLSKLRNPNPGIEAAG